MSEKKTRLEIEIDKHDELFSKGDDYILKEINYSRKQMELDLEQLKLWLKDQHHLPECRLTESDNFLKNYLSGCKGSLKTAKRKLDSYYSFRGKSEVYKDRDVLDEHYRKVFETYYQHIVPTCGKNGEVLGISKLAIPGAEYPPNIFLNFMKRLIISAEIGMRLQEIHKPLIVAIDYEGCTPALAATYSPALLTDAMQILQRIFPVRLKKLILFNIPSYFEIIINTLVKPFLPKKIKDRVIITSEGCEILSKYMDKAIIPKDWNGDYQLTMKESNELWNEYEIAHRDWFLNELAQETDETKRVDTSMKHINNDSYFGVQGTLKKLAID